MSWLIRLKDKIGLVFSWIITAISVILAVIFFLKKKTVSKELESTVTENNSLKLKQAQDETDRTNKVLEQVQENKAAVSEAQTTIDDVVHGDSVETDTPIKGKDFILSILAIFIFPFFFSACGTTTVKTEYVYVKPDYVKLYEIQPQQYTPVTFTSVDRETYTITYDELLRLTNHVNDLRSIVDKLNGQIRVYTEFVKNEQSK